MNKDSDITPLNTLSPTVKEAYTNLKWAGRLGFWIQLVLGVISTVVLFLAIATSGQSSTPGTGFGIFCAACGLVSLAIAIYFASRYGKIAKLLVTGTLNRPTKASTIKIIQLGLIVNIVGMLLTILGAETIVGIVLKKSLALSPGVVGFGKSPEEFVTPLDLLIIQANTNTIAAHFAGIVTSLWLLKKMNKQSK
ncbi:MAG: DUF3611 family protein [Cyanobacteria bacterium J083]|nr:MAG: DUF3611 family protein [Cyanobacteria bacterium J083]